LVKNNFDVDTLRGFGNLIGRVAEADRRVGHHVVAVARADQHQERENAYGKEESVEYLIHTVLSTNTIGRVGEESS
jgi:hypothetical protein